MPDLARTLAVAREAGGGQGIDRRALGAQRERGLADVGPPEQRLERANVEVLAGVARGHDRDLRRLQRELLHAARLDQRGDTERLDRRAQEDEVVRVAEGPEHPAGDVDLDDVAPMDALVDPVPDLPDEDRRRRFRGFARRAALSTFEAR